LVKTNKISDGIVRLYIVAGERTIERLNQDSTILNDLCGLWSIDKSSIKPTAERFFKDYKK